MSNVSYRSYRTEPEQDGPQSAHDELSPGEIRAHIAEELACPLWPAVDAAVDRIRARHGNSVAAVLFYGSCLRDRRDVDRVLDFYLFTDRYRDFHGRSLLGLLNWVLPPNVYYVEVPFDGRTVRAKYAVLSLPALRRQTSRRTFLPTLWARLAQPCALPFARTTDIADRVGDALANSVLTMVAETTPLLPARFTARELWTRGFAETYRTEIRPERSNRPAQLYEAYPGRYDALARAAVASRAIPDARIDSDGLFRSDVSTRRLRSMRLRWAARRSAGRLVHVARLVKGSLTFADALDYALWKIETHSGVKLSPTQWQRRHPLLAAPRLAWRLYRLGAFK